LAYVHLKVLAKMSPMLERYSRNSGIPTIAYTIVVTLPTLDWGARFP
jgi:hypothetical protein